MRRRADAMAQMLNLNGNKVLVFDSAEALAAFAGQAFASEAEKAISDHGRFTVALAGGNTPRHVYEKLAASFATTTDWNNVRLFFGDERCVPPDHPDSNYRMAREALISRVPIPTGNVHRIKGELEPVEAAAEYDQELRKVFPGDAWPRFDFVFLGLGGDGHTASLFPGSALLNETKKWVGTSETAGSHRISLTLPVFNHAAHVVFLVTGNSKANRLREVLLGSDADTQPAPAKLIKPVDGLLEWLVDKDAASEL